MHLRKRVWKKQKRNDLCLGETLKEKEVAFSKDRENIISCIPTATQIQMGWKIGEKLYGWSGNNKRKPTNITRRQERKTRSSLYGVSRSLTQVAVFPIRLLEVVAGQYDQVSQEDDPHTPRRALTTINVITGR